MLTKLTLLMLTFEPSRGRWRQLSPGLAVFAVKDWPFWLIPMA
jgi:hypothetical protein